MRESFNANATKTLLTTGIFDALSTGILIYGELGLLVGRGWFVRVVGGRAGQTVREVGRIGKRALNHPSSRYLLPATRYTPS